MTLEERAWLAGLLEGEGNFGLDKMSPFVRLGMTDRDVVERAARLMGARRVLPREDPRRKTQWRASVGGRTALALMVELQPLFGERRSAAIAHIRAEAEPRYADRRCGCGRLIRSGRCDKRRCSKRCVTKRAREPREEAA